MSFVGDRNLRMLSEVCDSIYGLLGRIIRSKQSIDSIKIRHFLSERHARVL